MNTAKPEYLPQHVAWHTSDTAPELASLLATAIANCLKQELEQQPRVSLAVSGVLTPTAMFSALSQQQLALDRVDITLVD